MTDWAHDEIDEYQNIQMACDIAYVTICMRGMAQKLAYAAQNTTEWHNIHNAADPQNSLGAQRPARMPQCT